MARSIRKQLGVLFPSKRRRVKQSEEHYTESRRRRLEGGRTVVWFSCGATSAVAAKLAIMRYDGTRDVRICYCDTGSEHPDNARFLRDCEEWFGREVEILRSAEYRDIWDVYRRTRYLVGVRGARCTVELKKKMRQQYEQIASDIQVFGLVAVEADRVARFRQNNPEMYLETPLIDRGLDKADCLAIIEKSGIEIPMMYRLKFNHSNCVPCVKGQQGYWNKIRKAFPEAFERMSAMEQELGVAINKTYRGGERTRVFLKDLPENAGNYDDEPDISCGLGCGEVMRELEECEA
ncbi:hypothetical protein LCGC14_2384390 [marine sediment metagenome]|uniref:Phosphoadenosine phosphosulphate reductase domain-containing protein n=1 Tax=marine sediment metagenome TaxID=412755 RepID=A0A0F9C006_9ZZZZ